MSAKYIIRLDDAVPTMNHGKWKAIEALLDDFNIKPIVAVVPDNRDSSLTFDKEADDFWITIKRWQDKGWSIAMHGCHHTYHRIKEDISFVPIHKRSEFAGLTKNQQRRKIAKSNELFISNKIRTDIFVAPSHTFDDNTLAAVSEETNIRIFSDGIAVAPFKYKGFIFIPQQLWEFVWRPFGVWTVCLHPNSMESEDLDRLRKHLLSNRYPVVNLSSLDLTEPSSRTIVDYSYEFVFWNVRRIKKYFRSLISFERL